MPGVAAEWFPGFAFDDSRGGRPRRSARPAGCAWPPRRPSSPRDCTAGRTGRAGVPRRVPGRPRPARRQRRAALGRAVRRGAGHRLGPALGAGGCLPGRVGRPLGRAARGPPELGPWLRGGRQPAGRRPAAGGVDRPGRARRGDAGRRSACSCSAWSWRLRGLSGSPAGRAGGGFRLRPPGLRRCPTSARWCCWSSASGAAPLRERSAGYASLACLLATLSVSARLCPVGPLAAATPRGCFWGSSSPQAASAGALAWLAAGKRMPAGPLLPLQCWLGLATVALAGACPAGGLAGDAATTARSELWRSGRRFRLGGAGGCRCSPVLLHGRRHAPPEQVDSLAVAGLLAGVFAGCLALPWDTPGSWLAYRALLTWRGATLAGWPSPPASFTRALRIAWPAGLHPRPREWLAGGGRGGPVRRGPAWGRCPWRPWLPAGIGARRRPPSWPRPALWFRPRPVPLRLGPGRRAGRLARPRRPGRSDRAGVPARPRPEPRRRVGPLVAPRPPRRRPLQPARLAAVAGPAPPAPSRGPLAADFAGTPAGAAGLAGLGRRSWRWASPSRWRGTRPSPGRGSTPCC